MGNVYGRVNQLAEQLAMRRTDISKLQLVGCNPSKTKQECRTNLKVSSNHRVAAINDEGDEPDQSPPSIRITRQLSRQMRSSSSRRQQVRQARSGANQSSSDLSSHSRVHSRSRLRRSARIASSTAAATGGSVRVVSPSLISSHGSSSRLACVRRSMRLRQANRRPSNERSSN